MIKKNLLKTILTATVVATVLMTTACGSKQTSDNTTVQQEAVKVVSNVDVKSEADKKESEKKEEADKEQTTEAGETTEETKEEAADNAEQNDEAVAGEINETFEELKEAVNEPQNTAEAPVQEEQAAPVDTDHRIKIIFSIGKVKGIGMDWYDAIFKPELFEALKIFCSCYPKVSCIDLYAEFFC